MNQHGKIFPKPSKFRPKTNIFLPIFPLRLLYIARGQKSNSNEYPYYVHIMFSTYTILSTYPTIRLSRLNISFGFVLVYHVHCHWKTHCWNYDYWWRSRPYFIHTIVRTSRSNTNVKTTYNMNCKPIRIFSLLCINKKYRS